jgi:hypothetical protein
VLTGVCDVDYVVSSEDEIDSDNDAGYGPPRKRSRHSQSSMRRRSERLG